MYGKKALGIRALGIGPLGIGALALALAGCGQDDELTTGGLTRAELSNFVAEGAFSGRPPRATALPDAAVEERVDSRQNAAKTLKVDTAKQILFGDTHVHTTYSGDAFAMQLPINHGSRGAFPPADACDYARYIAQLDFYFLTDHAKNLTPKLWQDSIESVRLCNETAGDPANQDLVAFIGWEWTQIGDTPDNHYGHHNVLFRDTGDDQIPRRPIAAANYRKMNGFDSRGMKIPLPVKLMDFNNWDYYSEFNKVVDSQLAMPACDMSVNARELPDDCYEKTATPSELIARLDQWGFDTMVFPHGTAWGNTAPAGVSWEKQLKAREVDNDTTPMIEVYSGHGNSEQYANFSERPLDEEGNPYCPEPSDNYLPMCWQAGEIIRERCLADGETAGECDQRAVVARQNAVYPDTHFGWLAVPGSTGDEWLDAGQARDMFLPAFNYRPGKSVQAGLAVRNLDDPENPLGFRWGFVASTDTHSARAGNGFKQIDRQASTDMTGTTSPFLEKLLNMTKQKRSSTSVVVEDDLALKVGLSARENERMTSFFTLGGLAAVHSTGRSREEIWDAMKRREVYGTSGPRMLLWFDLLQGDIEVPMGGEIETSTNPRFRVSAIGSFKQLPGCPDYVEDELSKVDLQRLAGGECYNPSDERYLISRIEVVRIRPQISKDETIAELVEDVWLSLDCPADPEGCTVEFEDAEFADSSRDTVYYVRAIQEPMPIVNAGNLRTQYDEEGNAISIDPCSGSYHTPISDECLSEAEPRAWSSPIYVDFSHSAPVTEEG